MNTKAMIEFLDELQDENFELQEEYNNKRILEVINLLKQGENYKKIVEEIDERLMPGKVNAVECPDHTNMGELSTLEFVRLIIKDIKEKYFPEPEPEPKKAMFLFEIEAHDDRQMNSNIREFESFINSANGGANERFHGRITLIGVD